jgi:dihydroorotase
VELLSQNKDIASFEITPNHLTFFAPDCYQKLGTLVQMNPPIREKSHQDALWNAIRNGNADTIGTDHAPHTLQEKSIPYPGSPSGMPGVQTLVPMLLTHIHEGRMSLERFVEMVGENPRRLFGCASKGRIEVGLDADFTIVDLKKEQIIEDKWIVSRCGWTPFNGMKATGWPTHTIIAGKTIMQNGELLLPGQGQKVLFDLK